MPKWTTSVNRSVRPAAVASCCTTFGVSAPVAVVAVPIRLLPTNRTSTGAGATAVAETLNRTVNGAPSGPDALAPE